MTFMPSGSPEQPSAQRLLGKLHFSSHRVAPSGLSRLKHNSNTHVPCCWTPHGRASSLNYCLNYLLQLQAF